MADTSQEGAPIPLVELLARISEAIASTRALIAEQEAQAAEDPPQGDARTRIGALNESAGALRRLLAALAQHYGPSRAEYGALLQLMEGLMPVPEENRFGDQDHRKTVRTALGRIGEALAELERNATAEHAYELLHRLAARERLDIAHEGFMGTYADTRRRFRGQVTYYCFMISVRESPYLFFTIMCSEDLTVVLQGPDLETLVQLYDYDESRRALERSRTRRTVLKMAFFAAVGGGTLWFHEKYVADLARALGVSIDEFQLATGRLKDTISAITDYDRLSKQYDAKRKAVGEALGDDARRIDTLIHDDKSFRNFLSSMQISYDEFTHNANDAARKSVLGKIEGTPIHDVRGGVYDWMQKHVFGRDMHQSVEIDEDGRRRLQTYDERFEDIRRMENGIYETTRHIKRRMAELLAKADADTLTDGEKAELLALAAAWETSVRNLAQVRQFDRQNVDTWGKYHPDLRALAEQVNEKERQLNADPYYKEALERYHRRGKFWKERTLWGSRIVFVAVSLWLARRIVKTGELIARPLTRRQALGLPKGPLFRRM